MRLPMPLDQPVEHIIFNLADPKKTHKYLLRAKNYQSIL